jgi:hypothetical protein
MSLSYVSYSQGVKGKTVKRLDRVHDIRTKSTPIHNSTENEYWQTSEQASQEHLLNNAPSSAQQDESMANESMIKGTFLSMKTVQPAVSILQREPKCDITDPDLFSRGLSAHGKIRSTRGKCELLDSGKRLTGSINPHCIC